MPPRPAGCSESEQSQLGERWYTSQQTFLVDLGDSARSYLMSRAQDIERADKEKGAPAPGGAEPGRMTNAARMLWLLRWEMLAVVCSDLACVLTLVSDRGGDLQYASSDMRNNLGIVLTAVQKDGHALEFASERLRRNYSIVLAAAEQDPSSLRWACPSVCADSRFELQLKSRAPSAKLEDVGASGKL